MRRLPTPDWDFVGWHYKGLHRIGTPFHNRLLVRAKGLEWLPERGGFLYAANHTSWWDPIVLQTTTPRPVNWLAKRELMSNRFTKWFFFDKGGCIAVDRRRDDAPQRVGIPVDRSGRNPEAFAAAVRALQDARIIGIFPEGTRYHGALGPARTGVARLALEAGAPVVPAGIATDRFWAPGRKVPDLRQRIYLHVGEPMKLEGDPASPDDAKRETQRVMDAIWALLAEARRARDAGEAWPRVP